MNDESLTASPTILREIQSVEREIRERVRDAEEEAAAILKQARLEAKRLLIDKRDIAEKSRNQRLAEIKNAAARDAEKLVAKSRIEAKELERRASERFDEAINFVLRRVLPLPDG